MYLGSTRRTSRSALGFSLDEVVNAAHLKEQLQRYTVKVPGADSCWLWNGPKMARQRSGHWYWQARMYITLERGYLQATPAKVMYVLTHGIIEDKRRIRHTCGETLCVRPTHIVLAQQSTHYWTQVKPQRKQQERAALARILAERGIEGVDGETVEQIRFFAWTGATPKAIAKYVGLKPAVVSRVLERLETQESARLPQERAENPELRHA